MALSVEPPGPTMRWRRLTKRSLLRTMPEILTMSHAIPSCSTFIACGADTPRASSLSRSRALKMMYGSHVLRVVCTLILPAIRSSVHPSP